MFRRGEKEKVRNQNRRFYRWEESYTKAFDKQELIRLRDEHPADLAQAPRPSGTDLQMLALYELLAHGNQRKAAMVARNLVEQHPIFADSLREGMGDDRVDILLKSNPLKLPSKPEEYSLISINS